MSKQNYQHEKVYIVKEKPKKKHTSHLMWLGLTIASLIFVPPVMIFVLIAWVVASLDNGRTNRNNGC